MNIYDTLSEYGKEIEEQLIAFRRSLHEYPELSMEEHRTAEKIAEALREIEGMEVHTGLAGGTGVMGILKGNLPGKCVILRADIDALPVLEDNDLEFKSKNVGCMHSCGHDGHATWILGSALLLSRLKGEFPGTVKFVFQPGEEIGRGAKEMILDDKILENPKVDMAFAAHAWPSIPSGKIGIARKYAFGCPGSFQVTITGKGGHGSWPHKSVNPIMTACQICTTLPRILAERVNVIDPRVISIGTIHAGTVGNIIPDECTFSGTVRSTKRETFTKIFDEIENIVKHTCEMDGVQYTFSKRGSVDAVENNAELVNVCCDCAKKVLGEENGYIIEEDNLGGENFSEYSIRVPATYMFVGIQQEGIAPFDLHSPEYILDESVLVNASKVFAALIFEVNK